MGATSIALHEDFITKMALITRILTPVANVGRDDTLLRHSNFAGAVYGGIVCVVMRGWESPDGGTVAEIRVGFW